MGGQYGADGGVRRRRAQSGNGGGASAPIKPVRTNYYKLVRDGELDSIRNGGGVPRYRALKCDAELLEVALESLVEKAERARDALTKAQLLIECADLYTVLHLVLEKSGFTTSDLENTCNVRTDEQGGFEKAVFLISVVQKST